MIPVITTERLTLGMPNDSHTAAAIAFHRSDRAADLGWSEAPHDTWRHVAAMAGHHVLRGFGPFVAECDGETVGIFGPWFPLGAAEQELKWTIWDPAFEGKGIAFEAASACRAYARDTLGWDRAVSYIAPSNTRSAALAARLGAVKDGQWQTPSGKTVDVWRHDLTGGAS